MQQNDRSAPSPAAGRERCGSSARRALSMAHRRLTGASRTAATIRSCVDLFEIGRASAGSRPPAPRPIGNRNVRCRRSDSGHRPAAGSEAWGNAPRSARPSPSKRGAEGSRRSGSSRSVYCAQDGGGLVVDRRRARDDVRRASRCSGPRRGGGPISSGKIFSFSSRIAACGASRRPFMPISTWS